ncbi:MAG: TonB-dependent receptor [Rhodospirillaceae bacterium]|nr:MAG: TonB-dependent receptor [Rhodospirillaceae bacterium]
MLSQIAGTGTKVTHREQKIRNNETGRTRMPKVNLKSLLQGATALSLGAFGLSLPVPGMARAADIESPEQIIVTARRVEERLQDVPISISVFDQKQLSARGVTNGRDLAAYTPSLQVNGFFGGNDVAFSLRGFGQDLQTAPTVAVYFAEAVSPRGGASVETGDGAPPGSFFDLQNVQVLKGPQGTLFGRNTTGGAVLLVPQKPTGKYEGYAEAAYGNYNMENVQAVANVPVNDKVRFRVGVNQEKRDGYLNNISGIGPSNFGNVDYVSARASLVVDVTPNLENYTVATFNRSKDNGPMEQMYACNPAAVIFGALSCAQFAREQGHGPYVVENDYPNPETFIRQWQVINTTTWQAEDNLTIKNIASYGQLKNDTRTSLLSYRYVTPSIISVPTQFGIFNIPTGPLAGVNIPFLALSNTPGGDTANQETYSEELQFQGRSFDNRLTWQAGGYMEGSNTIGLSGTQSTTFLNCSNATAFQCFNVLSNFLGPALGGVIQQQTFKERFHNYGVYEQATYKLSDEFKVTEGLRYTDDLVSGIGNRYLYTFSAPNTPVAGCFPGLSLANACGQRSRVSSHAPTWLIDVDYTPNQDVLLYAKYARGYRQGSINQSGPFNHTSFAPEHVDSYEIGAKTSFHGAISGTFNVAGFYNDLTNQQIQVNFLSGGGAGQTGGVVNAGKSRIWGFELESVVKPVKDVTLDLAYTYLNTKVLQLNPVVLAPGDLFNQAIPLSQVGTPLAFSPKNKVSATASYHLPLAEALGPITASGTLTFTDKQLAQAGGPFAYLPSYALLNLNLNWENVTGKPFDVELFMTNVTNKLYANYGADQFNTLGAVSRILGEPRMFGARVRVHFQ